MFDGIGKAIEALVFMCVIFVPLGLWKLIEIIIWIFKHIHLGYTP